MVSPAGGYGVICADYIESQNPRAKLSMARLSPETERRIVRETLPFASGRNPVDITASANAAMYGAAMEALLDDPGVDILICLGFFSPPAIDDTLVEHSARRARAAAKPVILFTTYGPFTGDYLLRFWREGVVGYPSIFRAVRAARFLVERKALLETMEACG